MSPPTVIPEIFQSLNYPLVPFLPTLIDLMEKNPLTILRAEPGSGKSTLVPLALMDRPKSGGQGRILLVENRRLTTVGIAHRMAELLGETVGQRIGYSVRLERRVSAQSRVEVLTEGLLVRRIQDNPGLEGVSAVIFDEFHERSLYTDLALALLLDLRRLREDLKILLMSATLDTDKIAASLDPPPPVLDCPGNLFPVSVHYRPLAPQGPWARQVALAVAEFVERNRTQILPEIKPERGEVPGAPPAVLVFLPGKGEIDRLAEELEDRWNSDAYEIVKLHGSLPLEQQRRIVAPSSGIIPGRASSIPATASPLKIRIILTTNVAETGLTVPGVRVVVDSGLVRLERFHLPTGMNRLSLEENSQQSADQRTGRAGRLSAGLCLRLWDPSQYRSQHTEVEIRRLDLAPLVLECALWGCRSPEELSWIDGPPMGAWKDAQNLLVRLGVLDTRFLSTEKGKRMARLGLHPRLGALVLEGERRNIPRLACVLGAILSDRDGSLVDDDADVGRRLDIILGKDGSEGQNNRLWRQRTLEIAEDLLKRLGSPGKKIEEPWDSTEIGALVVSAFPDRVALRVDRGLFHFVSGREGRLRGPLGNSDYPYPWIVAVDVDAGERSGSIRLAAPLETPLALEYLQTDVREERRVQWSDLEPRSVVRRFAGKILLSEEKRRCRRDEVIPALGDLLRTQGLGVLHWDEIEGIDGASAFRTTPRYLLDRIRFWVSRTGRESEKEFWNDGALIESAEKWLGPHVWKGEETGEGPIIDGKSLTLALIDRLGWREKERMDREAPEYFVTPAGKKRPIEYGSGLPVLQVRLQDVLGLQENPRLAGVNLVFHLLSPAGRPLQITGDIVGFWKGSYADVRREMRGRYPKHVWPEDPLNAQPPAVIPHRRSAKS